LYTDSSYVVNSIEKGWAKSWQKNNWLKADKKKAENSDLWEKLLNLLEKHKVKFYWVKGHAGHKENERCDELATQEILKNSPHLTSPEGEELRKVGIVENY
jgi:ribonuclease HI